MLFSAVSVLEGRVSERERHVLLDCEEEEEDAIREREGGRHGSAFRNRLAGALQELCSSEVYILWMEGNNRCFKKVLSFSFFVPVNVD